MIAGLVLASLAACTSPGAAIPSPDTGGATDLPAGVLRLLEQTGPPVVSSLNPGGEAPTPWFSVPSGGFAYSQDAKPDGALLLAYTSPATDGGAGYDRSAIVRVTESGAVEHVACRDAAGVWCFYPLAVPGSERTWFVAEGLDTPSGSEHALVYVDQAEGPIVEVQPLGTEPAIAPDGAWLAWIATEPLSGLRRLELGDADGARVRTLVEPGALSDVSLPFFSADGAFVYFVVPSPEAVSALDLVLPRAYAHGDHDVASDWWRVPVGGGEPEQVTDLQTVFYGGRAYPDGGWFAAACREGVVLVDTSTGQATQVLEDRTIRSLSWVPRMPRFAAPDRTGK